MKFYTFPMSNHAARVQMLLEELEIPYTPHMVNLDGDNRKPDYLKLNPNAKVPVIDDDGFILWESHAILRYLGNKYGPAWYPTELQTRARVDQWLDWGHTRLNADAITINFNTIVLGEHGNQAKVRESKDNLKNLFPILDKALQNKDFVCGAISIADLSLFTTVIYLKNNQVSLEAYPHISRWYNTIKQRSSATKLAFLA